MNFGIKRKTLHFGNYWIAFYAAPVKKYKIGSVKMVKRQNLMSVFQRRLYGVYYFRFWRKITVPRRK